MRNIAQRVIATEAATDQRGLSVDDDTWSTPCTIYERQPLHQQQPARNAYLTLAPFATARLRAPSGRAKSNTDICATINFAFAMVR